MTGQVHPGVNPIDLNNHLVDCLRYACDDLITDAPLDEGDSGVLMLPMWKIHSFTPRRDEGIDMNDLLRSVPRTRFPKPPG